MLDALNCFGGPGFAVDCGVAVEVFAVSSPIFCTLRILRGISGTLNTDSVVAFDVVGFALPILDIESSLSLAFRFLDEIDDDGTDLLRVSERKQIKVRQ